LANHLVKRPNISWAAKPEASRNGGKARLARLLHDPSHDRSLNGTGNNRRDQMNIKTSLISAFAALFLSSLAVGTAIVPASVASAAPVSAATNA
jgi:hypothetical protein